MDNQFKYIQTTCVSFDRLQRPTLTTSLSFAVLSFSFDSRDASRLSSILSTCYPAYKWKIVYYTQQMLHKFFFNMSSTEGTVTNETNSPLNKARCGQA